MSPNPINARRMLLASLSLSCTAAFAQNPRISDDVVRIGVLTDLTGLYSDFSGKGSVEAVRMAVEDFGGTVAGKKIDVVYADHQNKADVASSKAREWFDQGHVDMITDLVGSSPSLAVVEIGRQKQRVVMVTGAYSSRLTNDACSPYTVHYQIDTVALASTPKLLVKRGGDSWFFITADSAFGKAMEKDATAVIVGNKGKVLGSAKHPFNASDFSSFMLQAQASGAKMIALADAGGDMINAVKAANEFGVTRSGKQSVVAMAFLLTDVHSLGLPLAQNLYTIEGFYWDANAETRKFSERFFKRMNKMPTAIQAAGYSATLTYLKAVKATGTDDSAIVMKQMKSAPVNDIYAHNGTIREDGRLLKDLYLVQVKTPAESKKPWDYYNIRATVPAADAFQPLSSSTCPMITKTSASR
ncbi:ABC transporter permease [Burkholderia sp. Leaf177]|uniref:ABC transporter substrate-binding protein n=1 Tax=Burkholderia sp. Leaf177 TaxID=1736287 RepID=UPI0006FB8DBA|nr:ABC transporter substrate-binding protein [Burkholderia sp. Leaf177]KQR77160.1 ABC transporter permease [Burkholderia sp. Leaf177]